MEYFGPSMTEKEWLDRQQNEMMGGISSRSPMADPMWGGITNTNVPQGFSPQGTVYPGMSSLQQQFPVRPDFYTGDRLTEFGMENGVITKNNQRLVGPFRLANGGIASL
jgi:hypothetical protein